VTAVLGNTMVSMAVAEDRAQVLRADAARNRERIVAAAAEVFAESGLDASTAEIAQRAGVGDATLFRRFPTKLDLVDAVLEQKMQASIELMAEYASDPDPSRGIERLFNEMIVSKMQSDQGFLEAAGERCLTEPRFADLRAESFAVMAVILKRAQEAGAVREDIQPQDLTFLLMAAASSLRTPLPGLREDLWRRYTQVILDGLRPEGAHKLTPGAPPRKLIERFGD
jgi:AcrR family transcriptional regulator